MTDEKVNTACAVALGSFDGLHLGHRKVLESTLAFSKKHNLEAKVMLFDIHPREYITGEKIPKLLTEKETENKLVSMGFSICRVNFAKIRELSCEEFFEKILIKKLNAKAVFCGFNYTFGKNGKGNAETLRTLCACGGVACEISAPVSIDGITVSSTAVRNYLLNGEPEKAAAMLSENYAITGMVIHGDARGRTLGYPTANQLIDNSLVVPKYGVYETAVNIGGKRYKAVTNVGIRPTYRTEHALAETNIIGYIGYLYGKEITVELIRYLREERKFNSTQELENQLNADAAEVAGNVQ